MGRGSQGKTVPCMQNSTSMGSEIGVARAGVVVHDSPKASMATVQKARTTEARQAGRGHVPCRSSERCLPIFQVQQEPRI